jgi:hypothetical protein
MLEHFRAPAGNQSMRRSMTCCFKAYHCVYLFKISGGLDRFELSDGMPLTNSNPNFYSSTFCKIVLQCSFTIQDYSRFTEYVLLTAPPCPCVNNPTHNQRTVQLKKCGVWNCHKLSGQAKSIIIAISLVQVHLHSKAYPFSIYTHVDHQGLKKKNNKYNFEERSENADKWF